MPSRLVVLVSGTGSLLQSLIEAAADPTFGGVVVGVGVDRPGTLGQQRAEAAGIPTFVCPLRDYPDRAAWDHAITEQVAGRTPDLVVSAGFMKILGREFLARFGGRIINSHPALLPSFPGAHGVRDALTHGVKVTGCTVFQVDDGVDTGPILAQEAIDVLPEDTEESLHERIKVVERRLLVSTVHRLVDRAPSAP